MTFPKEIWTFLIVTAVTVLIWLWAAGETRNSKTLDSPLVRFTVSDQKNWVIQPAEQNVTVTVEGPRSSLERVEAVLRKPLPVSVPATQGPHTILLAERLQHLEEIRSTGVTITSTDPEAIEIELDRIEEYPASVKPVLPGITTEGEIEVDPPDATVLMPSQLRTQFPQELLVEVVIDRTELDRLQPGIRHTKESKLRIPGGVSASNTVSIRPPKARVSFAIRSRIRETVLESVRVQVAGPPEDAESYRVEIEPALLRNVTISADADLIAQIESHAVPVVAVLHLSAREREGRIQTKPVSYFMALITGDNGATRGTPVAATVADSPNPPVISLSITRRAGSATPSPTQSDTP